MSFYYLFGNLLPGDALAIVIAAWRFLTYYLIMLVAILVILLLGRLKPSRQHDSRRIAAEPA